MIAIGEEEGIMMAGGRGVPDLVEAGVVVVVAVVAEICTMITVQVKYIQFRRKKMKAEVRRGEIS